MLDKDSKKNIKKSANSSSKTKQTQKKKKINKSKTKGKNQKGNVKITNNKTKKVILKERKSSKKVVILTITVLLALALIAATYYVLNTPKFNISSIAVSGNSKINIDEIILNSGAKLGDNVVKSFFKVDKERIKNIQYISDVKVSIKFPSELSIKVAERESVYYAFDKEKNIYYRLDGYGIILEVCDRIDLKQKELLVNGITFDTEVKLGTKINDIDYSKILVYENIEEQFYKIFPEQHITKVSFENSLTKIYLNDKVEVILPNDTNLQYNLTFLKEILSKVVDPKGTIDMTKDNPTFISF